MTKRVVAAAVAPAIRARRVSVGRGRVPVLGSVDLDVMPGEHVALLGRNGCGKTSLLRALAGVDAPHSGAVSWSGAPLPLAEGRLRAVGVVLQSETQPPFAVEDVVGFGLRLTGRLSAADKRCVRRALDQVGAGHLRGRSAAALSGGEWQRVRLARAIVAEPAVLLLDEPTSHLDLAGRAALLALLASLRGRAAIVVATHDLGVASRCDRSAVFADGRLAACLPSSHPQLPAVASRSLGAPVSFNWLPNAKAELDASSSPRRVP